MFAAKLAFYLGALSPEAHAVSCDGKPIVAAIELAKINGISLGGTHVRRVALSGDSDKLEIVGRDYDTGATYRFEVKRVEVRSRCKIESVIQF